MSVRQCNSCNKANQGTKKAQSALDHGDRSRQSIREPRPSDRLAWEELWCAYNLFYGATIPGAVTDSVFQRALDPEQPLYCRVIEEGTSTVGFAHLIIHQGTWSIAPSCYLEDLFVASSERGRGLRAMLIRDAIEFAGKLGCANAYWHTRADNPARRLYDRFGCADGFVRYRIAL